MGMEGAVNRVEQKPSVRWSGGIVGEVVRWGGTIFKLSKNLDLFYKINRYQFHQSKTIL